MCNNPNIVISISEDKFKRAQTLFYLYARDWCVTLGLGGGRDIPRRVFWSIPMRGMQDYKKLTEHPVLKEFCFKVPCRKCLGCLADRRNEWASRCLLEAKEYKSNLFVTLTYRDQDLPPCLVRKHFQDFMKRLREKFQRLGKSSPRVFYRGEYGERFSRPHFHAILFNCDFEDKRPLYYQKGSRRSRTAQVGYTPYYTSKLLEDLWSHGFVQIAPVCLQSVKYVANYLDKGKHPLAYAEPPFHGMSRRPAIARVYLDRKLAEGTPLNHILHITSVKLPARNIKYFKRILKERGELYSVVVDSWLKKQCSIARASPKHWETLGISEYEYLQRREEKMADSLAKFGRKKSTFL